jgi:hemerythrin-like domain-containing protein
MPTNPPDAADTVTACLSRDNDLLDAILGRVCTSVESRRLETARGECHDFEGAFARHVRIEEELLFPLFEVRTGLTDGPTAGLRHEHSEMKAAVRTMCVGLERLDLGQFREGLALLREVMAHHNSREEGILYPMADGLFSDEEKTAFAVRVGREPR